jgi:hypothetical protein
MGKIGDEVRRRVPRLTMSLVIAIIFWAVGLVVPQTVSNIMIPGIDTNAGFLISTVTIVIAAIFLIRALSDALFLGDIVTDIIVRRLGIKEERSPKRAARDVIYIIVIILIATAILPVVSALENYLRIGSWPTIITILAALGIIVILIYDVGRILYRIIEQRAESLADRLAKMVEQGKDG